jgi:hypothetical protein
MGTALENRSVQILTKWDPRSEDHHEFAKRIPRFLKNHQKKLPNLELNIPAKRCIFLTGGLLDLKTEFEMNSSTDKTLESSVLAVNWAKNMHGKMSYLQQHYGCNVYYLGCGIANDQESMGSFIHRFNGALIRLIFETNEAGNAHYPRLAFHDIYTPPKHSSWIKRGTVQNEWNEEPRDWMQRFWRICEPYVLRQCYEAAKSLKQRAETDKAFADSLSPPASPVVKESPAPRKRAAGSSGTSRAKKLMAEPSGAAD